MYVRYLAKQIAEIVDKDEKANVEPYIIAVETAKVEGAAFASPCNKIGESLDQRYSRGGQWLCR
jgi:hypothetical protein